METRIELIVEPTEANTRLDVWLAARMAAGLVPEMSRAGVQRWIKEGFVTRAGTVEANPARKVRAGESYDIDLPEIAATEVVAQDIPLTVVYEDADVIVIDKPAGLTVHPGAGNKDGTLVNALLHHCGDSLSGINGVARPGIVHRIDKDTSGLLVAAKHDQAHRHLARQFARHSIHRVYFALVKGAVAKAEGRIEGNIGRHPTARVRRAVVAVGGKAAVTHYKVLERFGKVATLVQCQLETGRTHQIRVHMAHLGHPLLGDPLYGNGGTRHQEPGTRNSLSEIEIPHRQLLHAAELGFVHPATNIEVRFASALPDDMVRVLGVLRGL